MSKEWFEEWFDTSYYHLLYKDRDDNEAMRFVQNLIQFLALDKNKVSVLDLACGKGRHSIFLNKLGYDVLGVDLSTKSIQFAKQFENNRLKFQVHDMRKVIENEKFTTVFNLFTSFGYFDTEAENLEVLLSIEKMLLPKGILVLDFMNSTKAIDELVVLETKKIEGIDFEIRKSFDGKYILKNIEIIHNKKQFEYTERVQALTHENFIQLFNATQLQIIHTFGDFDLNSFDEKISDRLILIAERK